MPSYEIEGFDPPAPVARVTLRTSGGERSLSDVAMLIDSGADVSAIPESSVHRLGLTKEPGDYEVMAFDGSKSRATCVKCELIFLRTLYRGAYLVVDEPTGYLGRDVLNHISLVLDGPQLNWREAAH